MRRSTRILAASVATLIAGAAQGQSLTVVEVNAPAVNCVFNPSCTVTVSDSTGALAMPFLTTPGTAWLQSRTYAGVPGTPAAGQTAYVYRLSMTQAAGHGECVAGRPELRPRYQAPVCGRRSRGCLRRHHGWARHDRHRLGAKDRRRHRVHLQERRPLPRRRPRYQEHHILLRPCRHDPAHGHQRPPVGRRLAPVL